MDDERGGAIALALRTLEQHGIVMHHDVLDGGDVYEFAEPGYRVHVTVNAGRWLSLEFRLVGDDGHTILTHVIDTDNYDISKPRFQEFARSVESDIVLFLHALVEGAVLVGTSKGRPAMVFPSGDRFMLLSKGKLAVSGKHHSNMEDALAHGTFAPLR